jgi:hypothetical protein
LTSLFQGKCGPSVWDCDWDSGVGDGNSNAEGTWVVSESTVCATRVWSLLTPCIDKVIEAAFIMANLLVILAVKAIAAVYGLLALAVAILYSLTRPDIWKRSTEDERRAIDKGTERSLYQAVEVIGFTNILHHSMQEAMVSLRTRQ